MNFRNRITAAGILAAIGAATVAAFVPQTVAHAQADEYERLLVGIRLNSNANAVLKLYGNPNDVVVGDVGIREAPESATTGTTTGGRTGGFGAGGAQGGFGGARGGFGKSGMGPVGGGFGGPPAGFGGPPAGFGGPPAGFGGPPAGFGGGGNSNFGGGEDGPTGGAGRFPGTGGFPGGPGGQGGYGSMSNGGGVGQFGQTVSTLQPQQETTWIYNRRAGKDVVSYEFLVGQGGLVTQIRVTGYAGGGAKTRKSAVLGSTYKEVIQKYGYPEEQFRVGRSLIASYKSRNHILFQFLNQRGEEENPFSAGNKVIAIMIASVE